MTLPVDALADSFRALGGPRVLTAPPGSGKSTRVPVWCEADGGVLVVQPRRVAARSLAAHLASERGEPLGATVGYAVRGASADQGARILFVTPGVALRMLQGGTERFQTVVLDEFHERTLDLDLLLALVAARPALRLVVLSATLDGDRVAAHLGGTHLQADGRSHPVELRYTSEGRELPTADALGERVAAALEALGDVSGDRLVFVPGRAEIGAVRRALRGDDEVLELHGRLSLRDQQRVFEPGARRRVIVATNVAETSLTLPRIGAVVDTGLVRRTHYFDGRGYLLLGPVAMDSADQRAGRAGRLGPGVAVRLWGARAPLEARTPPELQRESLVPLVLAAATAGHPDLSLPFLDPPPPHAVDAAREQLRELGALDADGRATARARRLFQLPLDAHAAHLLVEAEARGQLDAAIDLVVALGARRPLLRWPRPEPDPLRDAGCDATALIEAVRHGDPREHALDADVLAELRREAKRLAEALGGPQRRPLDRDALAATVLAAWPRCAYLGRRRKRELKWSNGGTEVSLDRRSAAPEDAEAVLALDFQAGGRDRLNRELRITAAMPISYRALASLGLGVDRLRQATWTGGELQAVVERVYAGTALTRTERSVRGALAREAIAERLLANRIWRGFGARYRARHRLYALSQALSGQPPPLPPQPGLEAALHRNGLDTVDELQLLEPDDLLPPALSDVEVASLERDFPETLELGTDRFRVEVRPEARTVELHNLGARVRALPRVAWLPSFRGYDVVLVDRGVRRWLRRR